MPESFARVFGKIRWAMAEEGLLRNLKI